MKRRSCHALHDPSPMRFLASGHSRSTKTKNFHPAIEPSTLFGNSQIARVDRVLSGEGQHLLLIGRSGVGRREATVSVSHLNISSRLGLRQSTIERTQHLKLKHAERQEAEKSQPLSYPYPYYCIPSAWYVEEISVKKLSYSRNTGTIIDSTHQVVC